MDTLRNAMSEADLIEQARQDLGETIEPGDLLGACESFYGHGFADDQAGEAEYGPHGHFYRVHRWIVFTDSAGFTMSSRTTRKRKRSRLSVDTRTRHTAKTKTTSLPVRPP